MQLIDVKKENEFAKALARARSFKERRSTYRGGGWTIDAVRSAIDLQRRGDFSRITQLAAAMSRDSAYTGPLSKRINSLLRSDTEFLPANIEDKKSVKIRDFVEEIFNEVVDENKLKRLIQNYLEVGIGLAFVEWNTLEDDILIPTFHVLSPEFIIYDYIEECLKYRTEDQGDIIIEPNDGNWIMLSDWQYGSSSGFASRLGENWIMRGLTLADWMQGNQTHQNIITLIKEEDSASAASLDEEIRQEFVEQVHSDLSERVIYTPKGFVVDFQPENGNYRPEAFKELNQQCIRQFQIAILGGNLSTEVTNTGGNRAASQTHYSVEKELSETDSKVLGSTLSRQFLPWLVSFNFGEELRELSPSVTWIIRAGESINDIVSSMNSLMSIIQNAKEAGYEIENIEDIASKLGLSLKKLPENTI